MDEMKATPRPWRVGRNAYGQTVIIAGHSDKKNILCTFSLCDSAANDIVAEEFVTAVNEPVRNRYARRDVAVVRDGKIAWTTITMHRDIMGVDSIAVQVDHINHNGLDNTRSNLRVCDMAHNQGNSRLRKDNKSGCKGIYWNQSKCRWVAQIGGTRNRKSLGEFTNKEEAVMAYQRAAEKRYGQFAHVPESRLRSVLKGWE